MEFSALKMLYATHVIEGKSKKARRNKIIGYTVSGAIGFLAGCFLF